MGFHRLIPPVSAERQCPELPRPDITSGAPSFLAGSLPIAFARRSGNTQAHRSTSELLTSLDTQQPSTSISPETSSTFRATEYESLMRQEETPTTLFTQSKLEENFTVEELPDDENDFVRDISIIEPDEYEDFETVGPAEDSDYLRAANLRRQRRQRKRELALDFQDICLTLPGEHGESNGQLQLDEHTGDVKLGKRFHNQSVEGDDETCNLEELDGHDVRTSARRLRQRVQGPADRK